MSDRSEEFKALVESHVQRDQSRGSVSEATELRNRNTSEQRKKMVPGTNVDNADQTNDNINLFNFSKSFLSECILINSTLEALSEKMTKTTQKAEQISFSSVHTSSKGGILRELEEALNICSMNISLLKKKLEDFRGKLQEGSQTGSFFRALFAPNTRSSEEKSPILEHCLLVLSFLEARVGRITEDLESYKARRKNREKLLNVTDSTGYHTSRSANYSTGHQTPSKADDSTESQGTRKMSMMLQVENDRMLEEISRGLFESLSSTESQVLEIARLQATLQSHLLTQHDLTCRLFDSSLTTVEETRKGNEYLRKSGKDDSLMRRFLVSLILGMSLLLLMLHYFNK